MTKGQIVSELVKAHYGIPRKEMITMIIEKAGCTVGSANSFYYYFVKELGLAQTKIPKEKKAKDATPKVPKEKKLPKAPAEPRIEKTVVLSPKVEQPLQQKAQDFLKWRSRQFEIEPEVEIPEEIGFSEFGLSETEEAQEILRIIAE
jgi:hypothetical protein